MPPAVAEDRYQDADSESELAVLADDLDASLEALQDLATTAGVLAAPRDWLTDTGLDGADPDAAFAAARAAWEAGEPEQATASAREAAAMLAAAPEAGRTRAITMGAAIAAGVVLLLLVAAMLLVRRRGRRPAVATPAGPAAAAAPPVAAWPYVTLPPDGPPTEPPAAPSPRDEGASSS